MNPELPTRGALIALFMTFDFFRFVLNPSIHWAWCVFTGIFAAYWIATTIIEYRQYRECKAKSEYVERRFE